MAVKLVEKTKAFKTLNAKLPDVPFPGCESHKLYSDKYWDCYLRQWAFTLYHPVGTCTMGRGKDDPKAVVDSNLRLGT
jgi:choline dehydrogenase-like flavoprotein